MVTWINFVRAMARLYHFCTSDEPDAVRGRAECEAQYNHMVGKEVMDTSVYHVLKPPGPVLSAPFRIVLYILIAMAVFIAFGGHL